MPLAEIIQYLIHKLEAGAVPRFFRITALLLAVVALALRYDVHAYRNLATPEGMDAAQLARNISEGKGYTTLFVRPFSLYLMQRHNEAGAARARGRKFRFRPCQSRAPGPRQSAGVSGVAGGLDEGPAVSLQVDKSTWSENDPAAKVRRGGFSRYQPDFLIAVFNQIFLLAVVVLTFFIAHKLFDAAAAWLSASLVIGCELLWRFSASGLSTMLVLVIFLGLTWCVLRIEEMAREPQPQANRLLGLAVAAGVLTGVGALTRYAFGWTIIPVVVFLILFSGQKRVQHALAALGVFVLVLTPWVIRNFAVSGTPFGTAGFAAAEATRLFPQFQLERSIHPNLGNVQLLIPYLYKLADNGLDILNNQLPKLGGSWAPCCFGRGCC